VDDFRAERCMVDCDSDASCAMRNGSDVDSARSASFSQVEGIIPDHNSWSFNMNADLSTYEGAGRAELVDLGEHKARGVRAIGFKYGIVCMHKKTVF
jgi:hypothetical protein